MLSTQHSNRCTAHARCSSCDVQANLGSSSKALAVHTDGVWKHPTAGSTVGTFCMHVRSTLQDHLFLNQLQQSSLHHISIHTQHLQWSEGPPAGPLEAHCTLQPQRVALKYCVGVDPPAQKLPPCHPPAELYLNPWLAAPQLLLPTAPVAGAALLVPHPRRFQGRASSAGVDRGPAAVVSTAPVGAGGRCGAVRVGKVRQGEFGGCQPAACPSASHICEKQPRGALMLRDPAQSPEHSMAIVCLRSAGRQFQHADAGRLCVTHCDMHKYLRKVSQAIDPSEFTLVAGAFAP
jgi:hypothetical protein